MDHRNRESMRRHTVDGMSVRVTLGYVLEVERGMEAQWKLSIARESSCLGILSEVNFSPFQRNATHHGINDNHSMDDCDLWRV